MPGPDYSYLNILDAMRRYKSPAMANRGNPVLSRGRVSSQYRNGYYGAGQTWRNTPGKRPASQYGAGETWRSTAGRNPSRSNSSRGIPFEGGRMVRANSASQPDVSVSTSTPPQEPSVDATIPMFGRSLADYLSQAGGMNFGAEVLADIDAREKALRGQAQEGDAKLAQIYQWLMNQIASQDPQINQQYSQAQEQTRQNMRSATDAVVQGGKASDSQLAEAFVNLGIDPGNGSGNLARGRSGELGDIAQVGQANADYLTRGGVIQRNLNRENRTAAGYRGAEDRSALQRDLARFLAELETSRAEASANARSQAQEWAQRQYEADLAAFNNERQFNAGRDDEAWQREYRQAQLGLDQQRLANQVAQSQQQDAPELNAFDTIGQRLLQTQGQQRADAILRLITEQAQRTGAHTTAGAFVRTVHEAAARAGLPPAAILEAVAAAEEYWQAYRD